MGARFVQNRLDEAEVTFSEIWGKPKVGRFIKRKLSKARRRQWRAEVRGERHPRTSEHWESECNWKGW